MQAPEFWSRDDIASRLAALALSPLGALYGASVAYKARTARPYRSHVQVVCVGGLTAGGAGKTPVSIAVAEVLAKRDLHGPLFVDSHRHGAHEVGDEPLLLARIAPVIVARDRRAGAAFADAHQLDAIVMDDGHQNFQLAKDLSIVVLDGDTPFGNGRMLPAGPLREPVAQGLARADAVVTLGEKRPAIPPYDGPVLAARLRPAAEADLRGKRVLAFAGIGRPQKFFELLRTRGAELVDSRSFPDHHAYTASELTQLKSAAATGKARLMTTEKDYVRMSQAQREAIEFLRVAALFDDQAGLERLLHKIRSPRTQ